MMVWLLFIIGHMGLFFYNKIGSIIPAVVLPTTEIIEPINHIFSDLNESGTIVPLLQKKQRICRCFLHGCDSLGKIELQNKPFRKAIPCTFTITQIKRLYH